MPGRVKRSRPADHENLFFLFKTIFLLFKAIFLLFMTFFAKMFLLFLLIFFFDENPTFFSEEVTEVCALVLLLRLLHPAADRRVVDAELLGGLLERVVHRVLAHLLFEPGGIFCKIFSISSLCLSDVKAHQR